MRRCLRLWQRRIPPFNGTREQEKIIEPSTPPASTGGKVFRFRQSLDQPTSSTATGASVKPPYVVDNKMAMASNTPCNAVMTKNQESGPHQLVVPARTRG